MTTFRIDDDRIREAVQPVLPPSRAGDDDPCAMRAAFAAAAWTVVPEGGDAVAGLVRHALGDERALELLVEGAPAARWLDAAPEHALELRALLPAALERWSPRVADARVLRALDQGAAWGQSLVTPDAEEWPSQLGDLGVHAPAALWVRGDARCLASAERSIAMVGARSSSAYGEHVAIDAVDALVRAGFATISGAAYGIDAVVHRTTLAVDGSTIAVLAGGLDRWYPQGNSALLDRIVASSCVVAEVPAGTPPVRHRFLQRNRLIAALGSATVVVEAGTRSGSINTAGHAAQLGRPVGAVPGPVTSTTSAGCHRLIREYGAELVQSAADMRELVDGPSGEGQLALADPLESRILDALSPKQSRDAADLAERTGMSLTDVHATLGLLALAGAVLEHGDGWRRARR